MFQPIIICACCMEVNPCEFGVEMDPVEILKGGDREERRGEER